MSPSGRKLYENAVSHIDVESSLKYVVYVVSYISSLRTLVLCLVLFVRWLYNILIILCSELPFTLRYARSFDVDCVLTTKKGDFHDFKTPETLQFECFRALAYGTKCNIVYVKRGGGSETVLTHNFILVINYNRTANCAPIPTR